MASNTKQDDMERWVFPSENTSREEIAALWADLAENGPVHGTPDKK